MNSITVKFLFGTLALLFLGVLMYFYALIAFNIIGGFIVYLLIAELLDRLEHRGFSTGQAYLILGLCALICTILAILYLSIPVYEQTKQFISQGPEIFAKFQEDLTPLHERIPFTKSLTANILASMQNSLLATLKGIFVASGGLITTLLTLPIITGVLLASRKSLKETLLSLVPNNYFEISVTITSDITDHIQKYVFAKTLETLALIVIFAIGFVFIGLPNPFLFATLSALLNIIPIIGILLNIPLLALAAATGGGVVTFILALVVLMIAQILDNTLLQAWIIAKIVDVHPFIVVVATLVGGELLGFAGFIIAIPAYVIGKTILLGLYEYLKAVQRHESLLTYEKQYQEKHAQN